MIDIKEEPLDEMSDFADISQIIKMTSGFALPSGKDLSPLTSGMPPPPAHSGLTPLSMRFMGESMSTNQSRELLYEIGSDGRERFTCKYCGEVMSNIREYKGKQLFCNDIGEGGGKVGVKVEK